VPPTAASLLYVAASSSAITLGGVGAVARHANETTVASFVWKKRVF
jgi:hypothetical protein